jgi:hypothetical protein
LASQRDALQDQLKDAEAQAQQAQKSGRALGQPAGRAPSVTSPNSCANIQTESFISKS